MDICYCDRTSDWPVFVCLLLRAKFGAKENEDKVSQKICPTERPCLLLFFHFSLCEPAAASPEQSIILLVVSTVSVSLALKTPVRRLSLWSSLRPSIIACRSDIEVNG
ncbi:unnamed protein product [Rhizophagus irregularis]|uniref:Uncharacterized protein n=1 Tax=Rhizophagus irregularis TaxID=588596 RepID=A0A915Z5G0_9GLOM|nr:unnamed protein product [Rhizophagus irregularis]